MATLPISPDVTSEVNQVTNYVQNISRYDGFMVIVSSKGSNKLKTIESVNELFEEYGEPDIITYEKYAYGLITAQNFIQYGGVLKVLRCADPASTLSNLYLAIDESGSKPVLVMGNKSGLHTEQEVLSFLKDGDGTGLVKPCYIYYAKGTGAEYNKFYTKITPTLNLENTYLLDIYTTNIDGTPYIIESFYVSYDSDVTDMSGDSRYLEYVVNKFSASLKAGLNDDNVSLLKDFTSGDNVIDIESDPPVAPNDGDRYIVGSSATGDWAGHETEIAIYSTLAAGWNFETVTKGEVYRAVSPEPDGSYQKWIFDGDSWENFDYGTALFTPASPTDHSYKQLLEGGDGALLVNGKVDRAAANTLLIAGLNGLLDPIAVDPESTDYLVVIDPGYPSVDKAGNPIGDVKAAIFNLCQYMRRDCFAIADNGDNVTIDDEVYARENSNNYNTFYGTLLCNYTQYFDSWAKQNVWVSPVYHYVKLLGAEFSARGPGLPVAGYRRGIVNGLEDLRYKANKAERDTLYLKQLNLIAHFTDANVFWTQMTTQTMRAPLSFNNNVLTWLIIDKNLRNFAKYYLQERNTEYTWNLIEKAIGSYLDHEQSEKTIESYTLSVSASDYEKKLGIVVVDISIKFYDIIEHVKLRYTI